MISGYELIIYNRQLNFNRHVAYMKKQSIMQFGVSLSISRDENGLAQC